MLVDTFGLFRLVFGLSCQVSSFFSGYCVVFFGLNLFSHCFSLFDKRVNLLGVGVGEELKR